MIEDERETVMNSDLKGETANATMKMCWPMKMTHDIFDDVEDVQQSTVQYLSTSESVQTQPKKQNVRHTK